MLYTTHYPLQTKSSDRKVLSSIQNSDIISADTEMK